MNIITTWLKENYNLISLGVGVLGVLIGIISVIQAKRTVAKANKEKMKDRKDDIKQKIAEKQAELDALNSTTHFVNEKTMSDALVRKSVLSSEIEALKKQL